MTMPGCQTLITRFLKTADAAADDTNNDGVDFFDLWCGYGGASSGAALAGLRVAYAVDWCEHALSVHKHNHPSAHHVCAELPHGTVIPWPSDGRAFHVHGSPPCTRLSSVADSTFRPEELVKERKMVISHIRWFIDTVLKVAPLRWSMEQVASPLLMELLRTRKRMDRRVDFDVFCFDALGVPQSRRRVIAGAPALIERLRAAQHTSARVPCGVALAATRPKAAVFLSTDHPNEHVRATKCKTWYYWAKRNKMYGLRALHQPSQTVTSREITWKNRRLKTIRLITVSEMIILQCMPRCFTIPPGISIKRQRRGIANAVPPLVIQKLLSKE